MDGFEKHIRNNRDQFDEHKADREKMWKHIQAGLEEKKAGDMPKIIPLWKRGWFMVAASIAIVVGLGITLLFNQPSPTQLAETTELLEIDLYYENIVSQQVKMVNDSEELSKEEKAEFLQFMDELDEEYKLLKGELSKHWKGLKFILEIFFLGKTYCFENSCQTTIYLFDFFGLHPNLVHFIMKNYPVRRE